MKVNLPSCLVGLAFALLTVAQLVDEYDYVIVGSGPGGGSLA